MLLSLLKRLNPSKIIIAGFDGFNEDSEKNYFDDSFQNDRHVMEFSALNKELSEMFRGIVETMSPDCKFEFLTPSFYENILETI